MKRRYRSFSKQKKYISKMVKHLNDLENYKTRVLTKIKMKFGIKSVTISILTLEDGKTVLNVQYEN